MPSGFHIEYARSYFFTSRRELKKQRMNQSFRAAAARSSGSWTRGRTTRGAGAGSWPTRGGTATPPRRWPARPATRRRTTPSCRWVAGALRGRAWSRAATDPRPLQATEELHARIAAGGAGRGAQLPTPAAAELLDDAELLADDREIDADLTGMTSFLA